MVRGCPAAARAACTVDYLELDVSREERPLKKKDRWEAQFLKVIADDRRVLTASTGSNRDRMLQNLETAGFLADDDGMYNVNYYRITPKGRRAILK